MGDPQIYIVEGIPGAGKDLTLCQLKAEIGDRLHASYDEGEVMCSWRHYWLANIDTLRVDLLDALLIEIRLLLDEEPGAVCLFNRFHISPMLWSRTPSLCGRYDGIVEELRALPVRVIVPMLEPHEILARAQHRERSEPAWQRHLRRRLAASSFGDIGEVYAADQQTIGRLLRVHGLPYEIVHADVGSGLLERDQPLERFVRP